MYSRLINFEFAKQLAAWTAIVMLFAHPLNVRVGNCGCSSSKIQTTKNACCGNSETTCCSPSVERSCCSQSTESCCSKVDFSKSLPCDCGDQCQCSTEQPNQPLPAVPVNESQNEQSQSVALTLEVVELYTVQPKYKSKRNLLSEYQTALTAQQICALLSRFVV